MICTIHENIMAGKWGDTEEPLRRLGFFKKIHRNFKQW